MCQILKLDDYRPTLEPVSLEAQAVYRRSILDMKVRQAVMELYLDEPYPLVAKACDAASKALARDASFVEAMDSAHAAMYIERRKGNEGSIYNDPRYFK